MAHVTVVNDSPEFLELVGDILEGDAYDTTLIEADEQDALQLIRQSRPDVLMIDLRLGREGHHGWDVARAMRNEAEFDRLPIIICSGDLEAMRELEAELTATRDVVMLTKPFEIDDLTGAIDRLLDPNP
jgi:CheY-like chemotaxis protein